MSPYRFGFLLQWPLMAALTWIFKAHYGWAWAVAGFAAVFTSMLGTWLLVLVLVAKKKRAE